MSLLALQAFSKAFHPVDWRSSGSSLTNTRMEVCPPAHFTEAQPIWRSWMQAQWQKWQGSRTQRDFLAAQADFAKVLWDLQSYEASCVQESHCLLDLWHLRPAVFQVIARHRGEAKALERMACINRYFHIRMG
jgi:hypothetical protein